MDFVADQVQPEVAKVEGRVKSSVRLRYDAEVLFLKRQNGDLEQIRKRLGLSRRKICLLLLVDPSAWTRWTTPGSEAPPHIYRALDWYLAIMEKDPEYRRLAHRFADWLNQEKDYEGRLASLEGLLATKAPQAFGWRPTFAKHLPLALAFLMGVVMTYLKLR